ncbi:hypothetical protein M378DRAFT_156128 [Amanita muscaria Koide BX008]|uniref:Galactose oxidase n=1 Tax=Amanita muscaria (strain Koide BX008) TaxID=946122 RepID=A0A0C2T2L2_AMAMK|nr:hypothetical protein M378DRAFT_156128 [Amanita muscaria Koide BX008]
MIMLLSFLSFFYFLSINAQSISTSISLPPLQWISLSPLLQSSNAPPALRDAAIAYDENSRSLIVFGGESQGGFPQSQTYLLNLDSLMWSSPNPPVGLTEAPPARSAAIAGLDIAASYRHGFVLVGGKGSDGQALSDIWEFDLNSQFWSRVSVSPGSPSPRWGASGGIDTRVSTVQDPRLSYPNNTFYLAGGTSGSQSDALSDIWRLNISGALAANLQSSVGSWEHLTIGNLPAKVGQGGTVINNQIVSVGGCNSSAGNSSACAQQDSYVVTVGGSNNVISPNPCPAPRYGPALVPNMNAYSSSFSSQVFVLSGIYNSSLWDVGGSTNDGEIAVLDSNGGTWIRALPAGDPGSTGQASYPVAREGAAVVAYPNAVVGQNRKTTSDIIMFGGQDASGRYLSDLWLLRSYNGSVTSSNPQWSGGSGQLQTGVNADGSGVLMQFPNKCATRITASSSTSPSSTSSSPRGTAPSNSDTSLAYDTTIIHKVFAPLSVALLLPISIYFRLTLSTYTDKKISESQLSWFLAASTLTFLAYAVGIVGLVTSFAFLSSSLPTARTTLPTAHGQVGLAFFVCLYVIIPALFVLRYFIARSALFEDGRNTEIEERVNSLDTTEKPSSLPGHAGSTGHSSGASPPSSPHIQSQSLGHVRNRTTEAIMSSDTESVTSGGQHRAFEVLNRPPKSRHASNNWAQVYVESSQPLNPRSLSDVDWLLRRRSLNAVDELDYAITQLHNARQATPATTDRLINIQASHLENTVRYPSYLDSVIHIFLQASLLGISVVSLYALWSRGYNAWFIIVLVWTVLFYAVIFAFSWFGRPEKSMLSATLRRLRGGAVVSMASDKEELGSQHYPPTSPRGPYFHQPPYRAATREELAQARPISLTTDDEDDHIDEDTRQRMIEEEMERRDVSIVTVPRRRLLVANPS